MVSDEHTLVGAARAGDSKALEELIQRYRPKALSLLRSLLGNTHDAEDACQETCLVATSAIGQLRQDHRFGAWFLSIAYRKACDIKRQQSRDHRALQYAANPAQLSPQDRSDIQLTLLQVFNELPEDQRTVLQLKYHGGLSYAEIADIVGVPVSTVRGVIYRGTKQLRDALKRSFGSV